MTTDEQLREIRGRLEAITRQPWRVNTIDHVGEDWLIGCVMNLGNSSIDGCDYIVSTDGIHASEMDTGDAKIDAEFIASAPAYIRTLLDAIAELQEKLRPGSPTERAPTEWAYNAACKALENAKATIAEREAEIERLRDEMQHFKKLAGFSHKGFRGVPRHDQ